eukprot:scaffold7434_cov65-Attheya_sp.AAC.1
MTDKTNVQSIDNKQIHARLEKTTRTINAGCSPPSVTQKNDLNAGWHTRGVLEKACVVPRLATQHHDG